MSREQFWNDKVKAQGKGFVGFHAHTAEQFEAKTKEWQSVFSPVILGVIPEKLKKFKHALDFGCGWGRMTPWLTNFASKVTAVDHSSEALKLAEAPSSAVMFQHASKWKPRKKIYDLIFSCTVLQHVTDPEEAKAICNKLQAASLKNVKIVLFECSDKRVNTVNDIGRERADWEKLFPACKVTEMHRRNEGAGYFHSVWLVEKM